MISFPYREFHHKVILNYSKLTLQAAVTLTCSSLSSYFNSFSPRGSQLMLKEGNNYNHKITSVQGVSKAYCIFKLTT